MSKSKKVKMPKGIERPDGTVQIAVRFDKAVFKAICARAIKENRPFSDMANTLASCGELDYKEADRDFAETKAAAPDSAHA